MYSQENPPRTKIDQLISGYKLLHELEPGQRLEDLVLDCPDGKLYYQCFARDNTYDPENLCDLWRTADLGLTVRIRRKDGRVDSLAYPSED